MKKIYKVLGIKRMFKDWYQHKDAKGNYVDDFGVGFTIKGVYFNGAKIKAIFRDDKRLAIKYMLDCIKSVYNNMRYFKHLDNKKLILE